MISQSSNGAVWTQELTSSASSGSVTIALSTPLANGSYTLQAFVRNGTTIILTTHNKGVIDSLKKHVITMDRVKIIRDEREGKYIL